VSNANGGSLLADQNVVFGTTPEIPAQTSTITTGMVLTETTTREHISPEGGNTESPCLVAQRRSDLSAEDRELEERVANPQRDSIRKVYSGKWGVFQRWCDKNKVASQDPTSMDLQRFFLYLFKEKGLLPGTIQGYSSALANCLYGKVQWDISKDESLKRLIDSFYRDKPACLKRLPPWDLRIVLQSLIEAPFEPLAKAPLKFVTFKTVFLITLASGKRRSEIHALLESRVRHSNNWSKVVLEPSSRFLSKNQIAKHGTNIFKPIVIEALGPTLSGELSDDKKLCPVRALKYYLSRTRDIRENRELLFISHWQGHKGEICKNTISSWLVQTIRLCLQNCSESTAKLANVRAHDIRALAASWAFKTGVALEDVLNACSWKCHNTFTSHYLKDIALSDTEGKFSLGPFVSAQQLVRL
jgi:hypothetical protein